VRKIILDEVPLNTNGNFVQVLLMFTNILICLSVYLCSCHLVLIFYLDLLS